MSENTVSVQTLLGGFSQAYGRYKIARNEKNNEKVFSALFETLNWVVTIYFRLKDTNNKLSKNPLLKAIKYVRNHVHHQWADALILSTKGMALPAELPVAFHEWLWKSADNLPQGRIDPKGKRLYKDLLENKPARYALQEVYTLFETIKDDNPTKSKN